MERVAALPGDARGRCRARTGVLVRAPRCAGGPGPVRRRLRRQAREPARGRTAGHPHVLGRADAQGLDREHGRGRHRVEQCCVRHRASDRHSSRARARPPRRRLERPSVLAVRATRAPDRRPAAPTAERTRARCPRRGWRVRGRAAADARRARTHARIRARRRSHGSRLRLPGAASAWPSSRTRVPAPRSSFVRPPTLRIVRRQRVALPGQRYAQRLGCEDRSGASVLVFARGPLGDSPAKSALYRVRAGRMEAIWNGAAFDAALASSIAYLSAGARGTKLLRVDLGDGSVARARDAPDRNHGPGGQPSRNAARRDRDSSRSLRASGARRPARAATEGHDRTPARGRGPGSGVLATRRPAALRADVRKHRPGARRVAAHALELSLEGHVVRSGRQPPLRHRPLALALPGRPAVGAAADRTTSPRSHERHRLRGRLRAHLRPKECGRGSDSHTVSSAATRRASGPSDSSDETRTFRFSPTRS